MNEQETLTPETSIPTPEAKPQHAPQSNRKALYILAGALLIVGIIGIIVIARETNERMTGELIGGDTGDTLSHNGVASVTVTGEDDEIEYALDEHISLPAEWPADMPIIENATVQYVGSANPSTGEAGIVVVLEVGQSADEVSTYYEQALTENDWIIESTIRTTEAVMFAGTKNDRTVGMYIGTNDTGTTNVTISISP